MLVQCDSDVQKKHKDNGNTPLLTSTTISLERTSSSIKCSVDLQYVRRDENKTDLVDASVLEKRKDQVCKQEVQDM